MGEARVKLAQKTGDDLSGDVEVILKESAMTGESVDKSQLPTTMHAGIATHSKDGNVPMLSEAVRALLIMSGCEATYAKNHWVIRLSRITKEQEEAFARAKASSRKGIRLQSGVPLYGTFEDWRREVSALTGQFNNP